ncbi:hypothetical protein SARC_16152 [Sphaeroforma arctica JP610]|uniref:Uncharacterized protein n=1 Tax=Sphaeroforma arctica JP610 TaxID=667725 RepID=A0A0L0F3X7_9EUKA|nr:hypothetical protein SARC_16152 [Sphaeroforma arctica JP610]KNC71309.1 hypothetical protein SARC_16152 [Sphaeroforma arctica JP610]|eukprot:XP_014145211.1 hypothetical protein SARC_16152 [Sphaeroforma arctica JP610]
MDWERPEVKALWNKFLGDVKEPHDPRLPACLAEVEDLRNMAYGFDIKVVNRKVLAEQFCILLFDDVASVSLAEFASKGWLKRHR